MNMSGRPALSIIVTFTPSAAKIDAYSLAITPPPSTVSDDGRYSIDRIESLSRMFSWSIGISGGLRGRDPVATMITSAVNRRRSPSTVSISTTRSDRKRARP